MQEGATVYDAMYDYVDDEGPFYFMWEMNSKTYDTTPLPASSLSIGSGSFSISLS